MAKMCILLATVTHCVLTFCSEADMSWQWVEDDGDLPPGVQVLGYSEPVSGTTYVMYHGTSSEGAQSILWSGFRQSADGMLGPGVYLSRDLQKASRYPINHPEWDKVVIKVLVDVGRVIVINRQHHRLQKTWHNHGYDTAWVPPNCGMVKSGLEENCVWDPSRVTVIGTIKPIRVQANPGPSPYGWGAMGYK